MSYATKIAYCEVLLFLLALAAFVVAQVFTGGINTRGLLSGTRGDGSRYFSPERVQLLLFTIGVAFQYTLAVLHEPTKFPAVSTGWLLVFGGSHAVYLGGKLGASLVGKP